MIKRFYEARPQRKYNPEYDIDPAFETFEECVGYNSTNIELINKHKNPLIRKTVERILECDGPRKRCGSPACAICTRLFRRWTSSRLRRLAKDVQLDKLHLLTLYGASIRAGQLSADTVEKFIERLRRRIHRTNLRETVIVGGIEIAWQDVRERWLVHAHLLVIGASIEEVEVLRPKFKKDNRPGQPAMRCDPVSELPGATTYVLKQLYYYTPGNRESQYRNRARALPKERACELTLCLAGLTLPNRLFLNGCARRGKRLVPHLKQS